MAELFPFQQEAVDKLSKSGYPYSLILDEPGLGKTYTGTALDLEYKKVDDDGPSLCICPSSLTETWANTYEAITGLPVSVCDPKNREAFLKVDAALYVCYWPVVRLLQPILSKWHFTNIIADEVQAIQNRAQKNKVTGAMSPQVTWATKTLRSEYKTGMSGTPFTNTPDKFWSVLHWLDPKEWSSYWRFYNTFTRSEVDHAGFRKIVGTKNEHLLKKTIEPFTVRRLKQDVLKDLPNKYWTEIPVRLHPQQRRAFDEMKRSMIAWVGEQQDEMLPAPVVIAQLTRLQQFSVAYAEFNDKGQVVLRMPSAKIDTLVDIIGTLADQQVVVFTQFKQAAYLAAEAVRKAGYSVTMLTGDTPQSARGGVVADFQAGRTQVFIGTIAAGGVGITLTAASTVIFLDRSWSPAINGQAEDRLHRISQKNAVHVIDLMGVDTVDQGRFQRLEAKKSWLKKFLD